MKNRAILARMKAKVSKKKAKKKEAAPKVAPETKQPETTTDTVKVKQLRAVNPETGKVEGNFISIEEAVAGGFNEPNIKKAIKNGTKYKGHLWEYSE